MIKKTILILLLLVVITPYSLLSQEFGGMIGYTNKSQLLIDVHFAMRNGLGFKINGGINVSPGTSGINQSYIIDWDEFPDYVIEEGSYYNTFDIGVGYFNDFFIYGLMGIANHNKYKNCRDPHYILGSFGEYCLVENSGLKLNYGGEIGYLWRYYAISFYYTKYGGFGLKLGLSITKK